MAVENGAMNRIANQVPQAKLINVLPTVVVGVAMNQLAIKAQQAKLINAQSTEAESVVMNQIVKPVPKEIPISA